MVCSCVTSTNDPSGNNVVVFKLETEGTPSLSWEDTLPTGGKGGASTNAGILQFKGDLGAVANYGSNSVTQLVRNQHFISIGQTINLAPGCVKPDSVALTEEQLFVVGTNCAESHAWPWGSVDGSVVGLPDSSAAQIVVGRSWGAVTMSSGSVLQLLLTPYGALSGTSSVVTLPSDANYRSPRRRVLGRHLGIHSGPQCRQLRNCGQGPECLPRSLPEPAGAVPRQRPLLGGEGAGEHMVYRQFPRARDLDILQRRERWGVLQIDTAAGRAHGHHSVARS